MNIDITIIKDIPKDKIDKFADLVVYGTARATLDMTAGFFPRRTGDLERGAVAMGVVGSNKTYGIGSTAKTPKGDYYAKYVWKMKGVNWTNPATLEQWYYTKFLNKQEQILNQAITGALRKL